VLIRQSRPIEKSSPLEIHQMTFLGECDIASANDLNKYFIVMLVWMEDIQYIYYEL